MTKLSQRRFLVLSEIPVLEPVSNNLRLACSPVRAPHPQ
jgi:hypothetical protein